MTREELVLRERQLKEAKTPEELELVERHWRDRLFQCQANTAERVKMLVANSATKDDLNGVLQSLTEEIRRLHAAPRLKESPVEWLKCNWMWLCALLIVLKAMDLFSAMEHLFCLFGYTGQ